MTSSFLLNGRVSILPLLRFVAMSGDVHLAPDLTSFHARWGRLGALLHPYTHGSRAPSTPASRYTEEGDDVAAISWNVLWVGAGWVAGADGEDVTRASTGKQIFARAGAVLGRMYRQGTRR
jgi:hypothetical protein